MASKKGKSQFLSVFFAVVFVLGWLGVMFTLFPVSNPLKTIGGSPGAGIFFAALWSLGLLILLLLLYSIRAVLNDVLESIGEELGVDIHEIGREYKAMIKDEVLVLQGKKERVSDHEIDEDQKS